MDRKLYEDLKYSCWELFPDSSIIMLDSLYEYFNLPITINTWFVGGKYCYRGWRAKDCKEGAKNSPHKNGLEFDCKISNHTIKQAANEIINNRNNPLLEKITRIEIDIDCLHVSCVPLPKDKKRIYSLGTTEDL